MALLARELNGQGFDVLVAVFYGGGSLEAGLQELGVRIVSLQKRGRWDLIPFLLRLVRLVHHEKPDLVHGFQPVPNLLTLFLKTIYPATKTVWGIVASYMDLDRYDWLSRVVFPIQCFFSRFADMIIVNSTAGRNYHEKRGIPSRKMIVIPNGIDTEMFRPDPGGRNKVREAFGIGEREKLIGLVGRLDPMKDHPTFLRAASILKDKRSVTLRFLCVGDGSNPYKSQIIDLARDLGLDDSLLWAGSRSDMPDIYNALDVAVSSSYGEGLSNVICEAMACGVPCVVTDVGDSRWIVGDCGIVVPPKSPNSLAESIITMLEKVETQPDLGIRCRQRIVENFGISNLVVNTIQAIRDLFKQYPKSSSLY